MGYYTRHEIKVHDRDEDVIVDALKRISGEYHRLFTEHIKWYNHRKHCLTVSSQYPDYLFSIYGYGEDEDGLWREDYYGGRLVGEWQFEGIPDMDHQAFMFSQKKGV
jgi:hypothetical protein